MNNWYIKASRPYGSWISPQGVEYLVHDFEAHAEIAIDIVREQLGIMTRDRVGALVRLWQLGWAKITYQYVPESVQVRSTKLTIQQKNKIIERAIEYSVRVVEFENTSGKMTIFTNRDLNTKFMNFDPQKPQETTQDSVFEKFRSDD